MNASSPIETRELLTLEQAAAYVHRSTRTIRRWVEGGDLPNTVRVKSQLYVPRSDLDAMFRPVHEAA